MSFDDFDLDHRCIQILKNQQISQPTAIQAQAIPAALKGTDVVATAQTGTGKTLGFLLPSLTRLSLAPRTRNSMLVLTPTRELAVQIHRVLEPYGKALGLRALSVYGGTGMDRQTQALRRGNAIIVATPGRLLDHLGRGNLDFKDLSILVLDEADRMLDMGFLPDIKRILATLPSKRQTLLFSATFPREIERLAGEILHEPVRITVGATSTPVNSVRQGVYTVESTEKLGLLAKILGRPDMRSALVFMRTKYRTDRVAKALNKEGFKAQSIHGDRSQNQRQRALDGFRTGRYTVLVATDVAARGLDIQGISHVINYDIPITSEEYIHRIGRTARANAEGDAITFVSPDDRQALHTIERALGKNIPREDWEGAVAVASLFRPGKEERPLKKRFGFGRRRSSARR